MNETMNFDEPTDSTATGTPVITVSALNQAVARLLERGFIQREIHGDDRRRSVLELLPAGFAVYEVVAPMVLESERRLLGALTEEERTALDRLITRLETAGLQAQAELR